MSSGPLFEHKEPTFRTISPFKELGAYEALWARPKMSFKTLADLFREHPDSLPSDFVKCVETREYAQKALAILNRAHVENFGVRIHGAGEYPAKLRDARHPIELLYFQGWWDLVETKCVAVVGTRNPSTEGLARAARITKHLVNDRITVVSGLAKGIDAVAHKTAIELGGYTIAVIGTPLSVSYPKENAPLQRHIAEKHLVISQVPIYSYSLHGPKTNRIFFTERNVTMSALTDATIIVEAGETSGTHVQARAAFHQGRKLFILDNCFRNPSLTWPAKFEQLGAIRVREYEDIKRHLDATLPN